METGTIQSDERVGPGPILRAATARLQKPLLTLAAALLALTAVGVAPAPAAEAFGERPFITVWNANMGVVQRAGERLQRNPTPRVLMRALREIARAENRIIVWLRDHRPTACQQPFVKQMISRGTVSRKSYKAAARAVNRGQFDYATKQMLRGSRFLHGMFNAGARMIDTCP